MCYDYLEFTSYKLQYFWFKSYLIDTTSLDTLVLPPPNQRKFYFNCPYGTGLPAYLAFRQLFDQNFEMRATDAVEYIKNNYKDKGLIVNFYFKNSDSTVSTVTRKFIYQTEENCDFTTGLLSEETQTSEFKIYPNPSNDGLFYFSEKGQLPENVNVYSTHGNRITVAIRNRSLDLSNLPKGIYFINYELDRKKVSHKLILNN